MKRASVFTISLSDSSGFLLSDSIIVLDPRTHLYYHLCSLVTRRLAFFVYTTLLL
ncbi:MAG: hypothetical protein ACTSYG_08130 [Candidatus Heimdallarchaeota archaeon]